MSEEDIATEALLEYLSCCEAGIMQAKRLIAQRKGVEGASVKEQIFTVLKFDQKVGSRIGEYEVAYKANSISEKWSHAYNILRQSNAIISNRYHGEGYEYSYWLYRDKIYRQKLKQPEKPS
jgi:hypothetical protein